ncbi:MAG: extensin family protein [Pseudomonadota bacterium]
MLTRFALILVLTGGPLVALAPEQSPRPLLRGDAADVVQALVRPKLRPTGARSAEARPTISEELRPALRPLSDQQIHARRIAEVDGTIMLAASAAAGLPQSARPTLRPKGLAEEVMSKRRKERQLARKGAICGDIAIQGEAIGSVPGRIRGCGVKNAVRVRSVSGVRLSQSAIMNCRTAKATKAWIEKGVKPAIGNRGGGVASLKVAAHYACRTRNNQRGAKISEHGKGNAIDISAITMKDGSSMTLLKGWRSKRDGPALKKMWRAACGPFGTVLGPDSDRFHKDHFHFDTARYRSGSFCR